MRSAGWPNGAVTDLLEVGLEAAEQAREEEDVARDHERRDRAQAQQREHLESRAESRGQVQQRGENGGRAGSRDESKATQREAFGGRGETDRDRKVPGALAGYPVISTGRLRTNIRCAGLENGGRKYRTRLTCWGLCFNTIGGPIAPRMLLQSTFEKCFTAPGRPPFEQALVARHVRAWMAIPICQGPA